ncbi:factor V activator RVV-V alpha-like [Gigantopelta aegis]|uniref:factor V activator RVV-V alpha-like n=1 Tax=Gigantopelta aegis TaxID=1735272 RepID=UPI001B88C4FF|nr:factor V activator RVV-V alpha-like [Gigantopelta aegis]
MVNFALYTLSSGLIGNSCGGVLLSSTAVLTQTACIKDMLTYTGSSLSSLNEGDLSIVAVVGDHRTNVRDDHQQSRLVTNDLTVSKGEVMIVRLDPPVRYTDCVMPVCLPEVDTVFGEQCTVAGWGQTNTRSPWSDVLLDHHVTLMSHKTCDAVFRFLNNETLPADYLCTDTQRDGMATCSGDQGGMLMCKDERSESEMLAGITNSTECTANKPSTYIDIVPYLAWIRDTLRAI